MPFRLSRLFSTLLLSLMASHAMASERNSLDNFDHTLRLKEITLPSDPDNPKAKAKLSCFYYAHFMIKQIDLGERGAEQLSIIPLKNKHVKCMQKNTSDEMVLSSGENGWGGYFYGVKGTDVFFIDDDGEKSGVAFAIYDGLHGTKIFEDALINGSFNSIYLKPSSISMQYRRVYLAPCSLQSDDRSCMQKITQDTALTDFQSFGCPSAYQKSLQEEIKERPDEPAGQIEQETNEDPSVLVYNVHVTIGKGQKLIQPLKGPVDCYPAE